MDSEFIDISGPLSPLDVDKLQCAVENPVSGVPETSDFNYNGKQRELFANSQPRTVSGWKKRRFVMIHFLLDVDGTMAERNTSVLMALCNKKLKLGIDENRLQ